jgi:hypothetical protein
VRQAVAYPAAFTRSSRSTISGRTSPERRLSTSMPGIRWPSTADSSANTVSNPAGESSLRSRRAHALVCGSVALTDRMKSSGRPCSRSYRLKASNGLDRMTPPKSQSTAEMFKGLGTGAS